MNVKLFKKVNKKSAHELEYVIPEIRSLAIEFSEYTRDSFKCLREILFRISKIVGPFCFHISDSLLEDGCYEITRIFTDISYYLSCYAKDGELTRESPAYYVDDVFEELHYVIRGWIRGIIARVRQEWRNIKDVAVREKVHAHVNYAVYVLVELLTDLVEGEKKIASLYVKIYNLN